MDAAGNLFIADRDNYRIRKVALNGIITTFAGNGKQGFSGDGGPAQLASLNRPADVAFDAAGNLYIADTDNQRIRVIGPDGIIRTIAGNGNADFLGDGEQATAASFRNPSAIAIDPAGNIYVADADNERLRRIDPAGVITTIAGNDAYGLAGDGGPPANALLFDPMGVAVSTAGDVYIADTENNRIRVVRRIPPVFEALPANISLRAKAASTTPATALLDGSSSLAGLLFNSLAVTNDGQNWLQEVPPSGALPAAIEIRADAASLSPGVYQGAIFIQAPGGNPPSQTVMVTFTVDPGDPPLLQAQPDSLAFALVQGSQFPIQGTARGECRPRLTRLSVAGDGFRVLAKGFVFRWSCHGGDARVPHGYGRPNRIDARHLYRNDYADPRERVERSGSRSDECQRGTADPRLIASRAQLSHDIGRRPCSAAAVASPELGVGRHDLDSHGPDGCGTLAQREPSRWIIRRVFQHCV